MEIPAIVDKLWAVCINQLFYHFVHKLHLHFSSNVYLYCTQSPKIMQERHTHKNVLPYNASLGVGLCRKEAVPYAARFYIVVTKEFL